MISTKDIIQLVTDDITEYLESFKPKAKMRRCLYCGEPFKLVRKNRYYCNKRCSRLAHYIRFNIRALAKRITT